MMKRKMKEEQSITKLEVALEQLRKAIQLFDSQEYVCSLTLAGAANEILEKIASHKEGYTSLDSDKSFMDQLAQLAGKDQPSKGLVRKSNNKIRNSVKHLDTGNHDEFITANFRYEAQFQIDSAIRNYWIAVGKVTEENEINQYVVFYWN